MGDEKFEEVKPVLLIIPFRRCCSPFEDVFDEKTHKRLLRSIAALDEGTPRKRQRKPQKKHEHGGKVELGELVDTLELTSHLNNLKKQAAVAVKRNSVLYAPVHKQQREKVG